MNVHLDDSGRDGDGDLPGRLGRRERERYPSCLQKVHQHFGHGRQEARRIHLRSEIEKRRGKG
jgi:hypothetical protein